jgi:hypothetical protein
MSFRVGEPVSPTNPLPTAAGTQGYSATVSVVRPADVLPYLAGDVVGGPLTFLAVGPSGERIVLTSSALLIEAAGIISGETSYDLHLYNVTPPSALADNAPFDLPAGDRAAYLGKVSLGTPVDLGATLWVETHSYNKQMKLAGANLFGYLVTVGAYTPTSARVSRIDLHTVAI